MILADSGVLIRYLRKPTTRLELQLGSADVAICGIVEAEVLHGARNDLDFARTVDFLSEFKVLSLPETFWRELGSHLFKLRRLGFQLPITDVGLATLALEHGLEVWTYDNHFKIIQSVWPELKLYTESV